MHLRLLRSCGQGHGGWLEHRYPLGGATDADVWRAGRPLSMRGSDGQRAGPSRPVKSWRQRVRARRAAGWARGMGPSATFGR